jgi:anti-anti-sigma regulatory factor
MQQAMPPRVCGRVEGAVTTVTVSGQVGWAHLPTFQDDLSHQLLRTPDVVVDLADLDSWSVTAQALFIGAVTRARQSGRAVAVIDLKDRARLQLERSGLASELYRTLWAANGAPRSAASRLTPPRRAPVLRAASPLLSPSPTVA